MVALLLQRGRGRIMLLRLASLLQSAHPNPNDVSQQARTFLLQGLVKFFPKRFRLILLLEFFLELGASVEIHPMMTREDLGAGIQRL